MMVLMVIILVIALSSLAFNAGYILHELGWFPHTKDRSTPVDRKFHFGSRYERDVVATHDFQVAHPLTNVLRQFAHADVYKFENPYQALENAIKRYEQKPTPSRYDDLIHLSNYICNHVRCDEKINELIGQIHRLIHARPSRGA